MIDIKQLSDIPLTVHDNVHHEEQLETLKDNEILIYLVVGGVKIVLMDDSVIELPKYSYTTILKNIKKDGKVQTFQHLERLTTLLAYSYGEQRNHVFRFYIKNEYLSYPIFRISGDYHPTTGMFITALRVNNIEECWDNKKKLFLFMVEKFFSLEKELLPYLWFGRTILTNNNIDRFLNLYRIIELLSIEYSNSISSEIKEQYWESLSIGSKETSVQKYYNMFRIPLRERLPFHLESHNISTSKFNKWRKLRNKITHGDLYLETEEIFRKELAELAKFTSIILRNMLSNKYGFKITKQCI